MGDPAIESLPAKSVAQGLRLVRRIPTPLRRPQDTPGSTNDGEVILGIINNTNSTLSPTLNVGARGARAIIGIGGGLSIGEIRPGLATFYYDALLKKYIYTSGGVSGSVPIEAQAALANALQSDLWYNFPFAAGDNYVIAAATAALKNSQCKSQLRVGVFQRIMERLF